MDENVEQLIKNLARRTFIPHYCQTAAEAWELIKQIIPDNSSVGIGGSMTLQNMKVPMLLTKRGNSVFCAGFTQLPNDEVYAKAAISDFYMSSANAITQDGEIVNIDGRGNRVAAILYGPKIVITVAGINKIVSDLKSAIDRVRNVASPQNTKRLNKRTPCAVTGKCHYCYPPETICRSTVITHFPSSGKIFHVIIINENLGY